MTKKYTHAERTARLVMLADLAKRDRGLFLNKIRTECEPVDYPGGAIALWDEITDTYYNSSGQLLKRPEDYGPDNDGRYY